MATRRDLEVLAVAQALQAVNSLSDDVIEGLFDFDVTAPVPDAEGRVYRSPMTIATATSAALIGRTLPRNTLTLTASFLQDVANTLPAVQIPSPEEIQIGTDLRWDRVSYAYPAPEAPRAEDSIVTEEQVYTAFRTLRGVPSIIVHDPPYQRLAGTAGPFMVRAENVRVRGESLPPSSISLPPPPVRPDTVPRPPSVWERLDHEDE